MKLYTTAQELIRPTARYLARSLNGASNGGFLMKEVRVGVIKECRPILTNIDGHKGNTKIPMIHRTFNYMIYSGMLEKSGYAIYSKETKELSPTKKAIIEFGKNVRLTQLDLVIPALTIIQQIAEKTGQRKVKTTVLFEALDKMVASAVNEIDLSEGVRKEPRYRQVIRNLISHRVLDKTGIVQYNKETKEVELITSQMAA